MLFNGQIHFLSNIAGNAVLVDTGSRLWCSWCQWPLLPIELTGATSANHSHYYIMYSHYDYGNKQYFLLVTVGFCSDCTVCITLHDSHSASFDYRRQRRGSEADLMTMQFRRLYISFQDIQHYLCL